MIVTAQFMVVLDVAIVNVALPSIKTDLHFSQVSLQWVITAYAIVFGGVLLLGGRLADLLGRRRLFMVGLAIFTVSSLLDGLAWSEGSLIAFRAMQGLGAALLSPAALSILTTTFREGRERNLALGIWGAASGSGGAAGVLLGGALTSALSWSWIFFINVPVGIAVIAVTPWLLRESRAGLEHRHFDFAGAASITGGLMLLVYAMTRAAQHGWGDVGVDRAAAHLGRPDRRVLRGRVALEGAAPAAADLPPADADRSNVAGLLMGGAIFSQFFLLTLYMQEVLHYSAIKTGVAYIGLTLTIIVFSAAAQALVTRFGVRLVLPLGLALSAVALVLFARLPVDGHYWPDLFPAFIISGLGLALAFVPMSIGALTGVDRSDAGRRVRADQHHPADRRGRSASRSPRRSPPPTRRTSCTVTPAPAPSEARRSRTASGSRSTCWPALAAAGAVVSAVMLESKPASPERVRVNEPLEVEAAA